MSAALKGHINVVQILLEAGAQRNKVDKVSAVGALLFQSAMIDTFRVMILPVIYCSGGVLPRSWLRPQRSRP
jgi:hypothetical protein